MENDWKKKFKKDSKAYRFLELANPDNNGYSREVGVGEFIGKYENLKFGNGADWARGASKISRVFNLQFIKSNNVGQPTIALKLNGYRKERNNNTQTIKKSIIETISKQRCIVLGTNGSCDKGIQTDHKNGRKDDPRVMNTSTQTLEDFQPLSMPANIAKRQFCKECKESNLRYDAKLLGYPISFTVGNSNYTVELGCIGCFWYDPIAFRQALELKDSSNN